VNSFTKTDQSGLKRLNEAALVLGDFVLAAATTPVNKTIRMATHSHISHAMAYVQDRFVIDATSVEVHACNSQRLSFKDKCSVHILRL
jgi:hypothetical protein